MSDIRTPHSAPDDELTRRLTSLRGDAEHLPLAGADRVRRRGQARRRNQVVAGSLAALAVLGAGGGVLTHALDQDRGSGAVVATSPPSASPSPSSPNGAAMDLDRVLLLPAELPYSDAGWKVAQTLDGTGTTYFSCQTDTLVRGATGDRVRTYSSTSGFTAVQDAASFATADAAAAAVEAAIPTAEACQTEGSTHTDLAGYKATDITDLVPGSARALRISSSSNGGQWTYVAGFTAGSVAEVVVFAHGGQDSNYPTPPTALLVERAVAKLTGVTSDGGGATAEPSTAAAPKAAAALVPASTGLQPTPSLGSDLWPCQYDTDGLVGKAYAETSVDGAQHAMQRVTQWPSTATAKTVASTTIATLDACSSAQLPVSGSHLTYQALDPTPYLGASLPETAKAWLLRVDLPQGTTASGSSPTRWVQAIVMQQGDLVSEVSVQSASDTTPSDQLFTKAAAAAAAALMSAAAQ